MYELLLLTSIDNLTIINSFFYSTIYNHKFNLFKTVNFLYFEHFDNDEIIQNKIIIKINYLHGYVLV